MGQLLDLTLRIWRQDGPDDAGRFEQIEAPGINDDMSFLEMLDVVNERLTETGDEPITFDHDCREGICGTCSLMIDGLAPLEENSRDQSFCVLSRSTNATEAPPFSSSQVTKEP